MVSWTQCIMELKIPLKISQVKINLGYCCIIEQAITNSIIT